MQSARDLGILSFKRDASIKSLHSELSVSYGRGGKSHVSARGNEVGQERDSKSIEKNSYEIVETETVSTQPKEICTWSSMYIL